MEGPDFFVFYLGVIGVVLMVLFGSEIRELLFYYIGIYENFGGFGYDLYFVEFDGEEV